MSPTAEAMTRPALPALALVLCACAAPGSPAAPPAAAPSTPTTAAGSAAPITVDAGQVSDPISPYVYGQFIEHLGRCIYGGLWAEMLEDRKFFYPVDGEGPAWTLFQPGDSSWQGEGHPYELMTRSPWLIIGEHDQVSMDAARAFAGEHAPRIQLPGDGTRGGLVQDRLGLVAGKRYVGRVVLAGEPAAGPIEVSLVWGSGASARQTITVSSIDEQYATTSLEFTAGGTTDNGRLEIAGRGRGSFLVGTASLMPGDHVSGWRADTLALVKELRAPVYRWPGGNFVSGYDWRDGVGERDRRPPRKNPAWKGIESNDVGIHEFLELCQLLEAEPYIAVNTGLGGEREAAAEVEYINGGVATEQGRRRAQHGHPEPWGVRFWAVGNEMYGDWQLGHMPLESYVEKHRRVVDAMRVVDPELIPIAVGAVGEWSRQMLASATDHVGLISEHIYWQDRDDLVAHVAQARDGVRGIADAHREYRRQIAALEGRDIRIALDEYNYWYGGNEFGELGVRYYLQDALGIAAALHEMFRNSDLFFMANYAQTVNVLGAIKTTETAAEMEATGLVLQLYRNHFGKFPVSVAVSNDGAPLDVAAAWTSDRRALTIGVVNPTNEPRTLALSVEGARIDAPTASWVVSGSHRRAYNTPGQPRQVILETASPTIEDGRVVVRPLSVTLFVVPTS